tara:strand:+ start:142 stop:384 length:243 start_codon:yes stop_codon:yes gene_type:complete
METENDKTPFKWINCYEYDELNQVSLVVEGEKTLDEYLEICAVGNHVQFESEPEIYRISKVLTQNGSLDTHIDTTCIKVK